MLTCMFHVTPASAASVLRGRKDQKGKELQIAGEILQLILLGGLSCGNFLQDTWYNLQTDIECILQL